MCSSSNCCSKDHVSLEHDDPNLFDRSQVKCFFKIYFNLWFEFLNLLVLSSRQGKRVVLDLPSSGSTDFCRGYHGPICQFKFRCQMVHLHDRSRDLLPISSLSPGCLHSRCQIYLGKKSSGICFLSCQWIPKRHLQIVLGFQFMFLQHCFIYQCHLLDSPT